MHGARINKGAKDMDNVIYVLEIVGVIAFAVSGAAVGLKKEMDIFGVCILGVTTACGGGVLRDIFLGSLPPVMFCHPSYATIALVVSIITFLASTRQFTAKSEKIYEKIMQLADAAGLGIFTAVGTAAAMRSVYSGNLFFAVFLGTITGVGGGLMRDVLASEPPYIFVKHIYALASIAGACVCVCIWNVAGSSVPVFVCCALVIVIRLIAVRLNLSLPKIRG